MLQQAWTTLPHVSVPTQPLDSDQLLHKIVHGYHQFNSIDTSDDIHRVENALKKAEDCLKLSNSEYESPASVSLSSVLPVAHATCSNTWEFLIGYGLIKTGSSIF